MLPVSHPRPRPLLASCLVRSGPRLVTPLARATGAPARHPSRPRGRGPDSPPPSCPSRPRARALAPRACRAPDSLGAVRRRALRERTGTVRVAQRRCARRREARGSALPRTVWRRAPGPDPRMWPRARAGGLWRGTGRPAPTAGRPGRALGDSRRPASVEFAPPHPIGGVWTFVDVLALQPVRASGRRAAPPPSRRSRPPVKLPRLGSSSFSRGRVGKRAEKNRAAAPVALSASLARVDLDSRAAPGRRSRGLSTARARRHRRTRTRTRPATALDARAGRRARTTRPPANYFAVILLALHRSFAMRNREPAERWLWPDANASGREGSKPREARSRRTNGARDRHRSPPKPLVSFAPVRDRRRLVSPRGRRRAAMPNPDLLPRQDELPSPGAQRTAPSARHGGMRKPSSFDGGKAQGGITIAGACRAPRWSRRVARAFARVPAPRAGGENSRRERRSRRLFFVPYASKSPRRRVQSSGARSVAASIRPLPPVPSLRSCPRDSPRDSPPPLLPAPCATCERGLRLRARRPRSTRGAAVGRAHGRSRPRTHERPIARRGPRSDDAGSDAVCVGVETLFRRCRLRWSLCHLTPPVGRRGRGRDSLGHTRHLQILPSPRGWAQSLPVVRVVSRHTLTRDGSTSVRTGTAASEARVRARRALAAAPASLARRDPAGGRRRHPRRLRGREWDETRCRRKWRRRMQTAGGRAPARRAARAREREKRPRACAGPGKEGGGTGGNSRPIRGSAGGRVRRRERTTARRGNGAPGARSARGARGEEKEPMPCARFPSGC